MNTPGYIVEEHNLDEVYTQREVDRSFDQGTTHGVIIGTLCGVLGSFGALLAAIIYYHYFMI